MLNGTWGQTGSPAGHFNDEYFSSNGIINITDGFFAGNWVGGISADWNLSTNWYGGSVPASGADVTIVNSAAYQPVISSSPAVLGSLTLNSNTSLTINTNQALTVSGNLANDGSIIIESAWVNSSGSLIAGTASGTGTVTYHRYMREGDDYGDKHLFSSPVGGQSISGFISAYDDKIDQIRVWDEAGAVWSNVTSGTFESGKGYNIYQTDNSDGHFSFTGSYVNSPDPVVATSPYLQSYTDRYSLYPLDPYGVLNHALPIWASSRSWDNYGGGGWNLLGNPFTSAMNAATFITVNTTTTNRFDPYYQALYIYDGKNGYYKYAAYAVPGFAEGGSYGSYIQAGQGFMVLANNNEVQFNFNSSMQVHNTVLPLLKSAKAEDPWPGLKLQVKYGNKENLTTIVYNSEMNIGLDPGYDVGQLSTGPDVEIYTALPEKDNSVNFSRQALPISGADKIIVPVGIDSEKGGEVIFSAYTVPLENYRFWLEDRTTGTFTNLSSNTYTVTIPAKTYGTGRFFIIASTNTPTGIHQPKTDNLDVRIWTSNSQVIIKGDVTKGSLCEIYDLRGKKILEKHLADGELNTVTLPSGLHGVYLIRVTDGMKVTTRKVALF